MAGHHLIAGVGEDADSDLTLGRLADRVNRLVDSGVALDSPVRSGYSPSSLRDCLYVDEPADVKQLRFPALRAMAMRNNPEDSTRGWAEIERRIEAFGLAGDD